MPELPEVETVARDLQRWVAGAQITDAEVRWARTIRHPEAEQFVAEIRGAQIGRVGRRAKSVLVHLADGRELRYRDVRKFGRIGLWEGGGLQARRKRRKRPKRAAESKAPYRVGDVFGRHGPEPLSSTFTAARLAERLRGRSARLKTLLLDQSFVAGVGNIYADEALWRARLHPLRTADSLTPVEVARLHRAIRTVLRQAISNRGTSFGDYVGADDQPGDNAERLSVYRRTGEPCYRCGRPIERIVVGQRSTHFCPRCQKAPEPEGAAGDAA